MVKSLPGLTPLGRGLFSLVLPFVILGAMSGQEFVTGIGIGITLLMAFGHVWSAFALGSVKVTASASGDVTLGDNIEVIVTVAGRTGLECAVEIMRGETLGLRVPASGSLLVTANQMGRVDAVPVVVQTGVPDGVVGAVKRCMAPLDETRYVYPAPVVVDVAPAPATNGLLGVDGGELTGLREYTPGDKLRDVHWPALARTGTVLVRDHRSPISNGRVTVVVNNAAATQLEHLAGMARSAVHTLIQRGHTVDLLIGGELGPVEVETEAWRRLACIQPDQKPHTGGITGPVLTVDINRGATWATQV